MTDQSLTAPVKVSQIDIAIKAWLESQGASHR